MGVRKLTRLLAPQTSEAPLFMHLTNISTAGVKNAVDQIVATGGGFDMVSGLARHRRAQTHTNSCSVPT